MRKAWFALAAALLLVGALATGAAGAPDQRGADRPGGKQYKSYNDNLMGAHARQQYQLTQKALQAKLQGKAKGKTYEVEIGQHALLQRTGTDKIFTIIVEFGNTRHPPYPDSAASCAPGTVGVTCFPPDASAQRFNGPLHNEIAAAEPRGRQLDAVAGGLQHARTTRTCTSTGWTRTTSASRPAGTRSTGGVHGWVKVPFNEAKLRPRLLRRHRLPRTWST